MVLQYVCVSVSAQWARHSSSYRASLSSTHNNVIRYIVSFSCCTAVPLHVYVYQCSRTIYTETIYCRRENCSRVAVQLRKTSWVFSSRLFEYILRKLSVFFAINMSYLVNSTRIYSICIVYIRRLVINSGFVQKTKTLKKFYFQPKDIFTFGSNFNNNKF